jgi:hypothetical protein
MSFLYPYRRIFLCALIILAPACASFNGSNSEDSNVAAYDPYAQSGIDDVLAFGATLASKPVSERTDACKSLISQQKLSPSAEKQLYLIVGRLLSEACGDIPTLLASVEGIRKAYDKDERIQRLLTIHSKTLERIHVQAQKSKSAAAKSRKRKPATETKDTSPELEKDEARLLREKLDVNAF